MVKNPPANAGNARDMGSISGQENPLEYEMATTPVFLPGKSQRQRSLAGFSPWGHKIVGHDSDPAHTHSVLLRPTTIIIWKRKCPK